MGSDATFAGGQRKLTHVGQNSCSALATPGSGRPGGLMLRVQVVDLSMWGFRRASILGMVVPPGVAAAFSEQLASARLQVPNPIEPFHSAMFSSS
jgi:hypothetical protein